MGSKLPPDNARRQRFFLIFVQIDKNTGVFSEKMPDGKGLLNCEQFVTIQATSQ